MCFLDNQQNWEHFGLFEGVVHAEASNKVMVEDMASDMALKDNHKIFSPFLLLFETTSTSNNIFLLEDSANTLDKDRVEAGSKVLHYFCNYHNVFLHVVAEGKRNTDTSNRNYHLRVSLY